MCSAQPPAGDGPILSYPDPDHALAGVRLAPEMVLPGALDLAYDGDAGRWRLALPATPAWRMEYRFELRRPDGATELVCDPDNPLRVGGGYGDRSVLELPGYRPPGWLDAPTVDGSWRDLAVPAAKLGATLTGRVWSPPGGAVGILLAHDGSEFDQRAALGRYCAAATAAGLLAPHHLVLLDPGTRNEWYSANPDYSATLVHDVLPALGLPELPLVGMGASLGALALLAAHVDHPGTFAGLFLQSGSFFRDRFDSQESTFTRYRRIVTFVDGVGTGAAAARPLPVALTCGLVEENLANNRDMAATLERLGFPVTLTEVPDGHNMTAWRDALHPPLTGLLRRVWGAPSTGEAAGA